MEQVLRGLLARADAQYRRLDNAVFNFMCLVLLGILGAIALFIWGYHFAWWKAMLSGLIGGFLVAVACMHCLIKPLSARYARRVAEAAAAHFTSLHPHGSTDHPAALRILCDLLTGSGVECEVRARLQAWEVVNLGDHKGASHTETCRATDEAPWRPQAPSSLRVIANLWCDRLNKSWLEPRFTRGMSLPAKALGSALIDEQPGEQVLGTWHSGGQWVDWSASGLVATDRRLVIYERRRRNLLARLEVSYEQVVAIHASFGGNRPVEQGLALSQVILEMTDGSLCFASTASGRMSALGMRDFLSQVLIVVGAPRFCAPADATTLSPDTQPQPSREAIPMGSKDLETRPRKEESPMTKQEAQGPCCNCGTNCTGTVVDHAAMTRAIEKGYVFEKVRQLFGSFADGPGMQKMAVEAMQEMARRAGVDAWLVCDSCMRELGPYL
jgi:hypothetical protein